MDDVFLTTGRMALRPFTARDAGPVLALDGDPSVMRFVNGGRPTTLEAVETRTLPRLMHVHPCLGTPGYWAAESRETGAFLGWFEFRPLAEDTAAVVELGYRLHTAAWGRGLATEGARALIDTGFTGYGVRRVKADTMAVNTASRRVMEKAGLSLVRRYTEDWPDPLPGSEYGEVEYALTREVWAERRAGDDVHGASPRRGTARAHAVSGRPSAPRATVPDSPRRPTGDDAGDPGARA
ncbi:GNAT family N-acetyltransferase [Streptomyces sp. C10-9-1]|uniref:GNAT family N-acetyltransferase n=1 Tax=Streptomyces sp. C10-9-1 TaxID=1859285 RepID=UPI002110E8C6|nr:GNAT family N-acetyltransferase [Streptomyces sp. C10-9-1]MCQ6554004.1 GNAT family N-acetyltransferase [Streptomyces sp. C10-9-1]